MTIPQYVGFDFKENNKMKIPLQLNDYRIDKVINENGDRCVVLSSNNPRTDKKVAIKCIPMKYVQPGNKEVKMMRNIDNKYIMKCLDYFYYPDQNPRFLSIVMPQAITDLFYYLNDHGPFTERLCCRIMKQALQAVKHLHENNIWHRDIKLDNIFVMKETPDEILVADFGLADVFENETYIGDCVGTLPYAAPELLILAYKNLQFKPIAEYSNKIDIWAMGVVLYALLSGVLPFEPGDEEDVKNLLNGNPDFDEKNPKSAFQDVTRECKDLIRQMLQADPNERFSIDEVLGHEWFSKYESEHAYESGHQENQEITDAINNDNDNKIAGYDK